MNFSKGNGLAAMAALALGAAGLGLPTSVKAGSPLSNINHIIVIYQENWTFDGLYGSFPGANNLSNASASSMAQVDKLTPGAGYVQGNGAGVTGSFAGAATFVSELPNGFVLSNPMTYGTYNDQSYNNLVNTNPPKPVNDASTIAIDPTFEVGGATSNALVVNTLYPYDLASLSPLSNAADNYNSYNYITGDIYHRYWQEQFQINGGNMNMFQTWCDDPGLTLSHFNAVDLPEGLAAQQYTICDNYFHSAFGGSFLNHQFLVACQAPVYSATPAGSILSAVDPTTGVLELAGLGNPVPLVITTTIGSKTVTVAGASSASAIGLYKNMVLADSGGAIPAGDTITAINSETSITLNAAATASETTVSGTATPGIPSGDDLGELANDSKVTAIGSPSFESYLYGDSPVQTYTKHYAVNTIYTNNLVPVGTAAGVGTSVMPSVNDSNPANTATYEPNIGDLLSRAGVTWKWYSGGWNMAVANSPSNPHPASPSTYDSTQNFQWHHQPLAYFDNYAPYSQSLVDPAVSGSDPYFNSPTVTGSQSSAAHLQDETQFYSDVTGGTLPAVSFIKPVGNNNEHPGYAALEVGMAHVQGLIQAVQANPSLWAHTMIVITYDEHGGRWDHVAPPHRDIWGPGARVPCIVISPYAKQSYIDHTQYDTSSILATIEARFLTQSGNTTTLNSLDANATPLTNTLTNLQISASGFTVAKRTGVYSQTVTITNNDTQSLPGNIYLALASLSGNTHLENGSGTTTSNTTVVPVGTPYILALSGPLGAGASTSVTLQFAAPTSGSITYTGQVLSNTTAP